MVKMFKIGQNGQNDQHGQISTSISCEGVILCLWHHLVLFDKFYH